ncbi:hypothetical protein DXG03_002753 [Asterophora parasitica]|uniref:Uncharacterized protein n=1 Tax=Asterophora parasitica TaxID=117018 RepID=A0A9P7G838_9AGAR|nr:hypothetical protein DXG03_002753 [Asterophora parasitica]
MESANKHMLHTERGKSKEATTNDANKASESLQTLQTELQVFLAAHTRRLLELQKTFPFANLDPIPTQGPAASGANPRGRYFIYSGCGNPASPSSNDSMKTLHAPMSVHVSNLQDFLVAHIKNIGQLRDALPPPQSHEKFPSNPIVPLAPDHEKEYEALASQFNMLIVIATFTASVIISYLSLVKSIVEHDHPVAFDIGMLISFFAMNLHFGNIVVAGRGSALASQLPAEHEPKYTLKYFHLYLELCEQLQFFATILFFVSVTFLTFFIFHDITLPIILLAVSFFGGLIVLWSAYWKVSMTLRNIMFIVGRVRGLRIRAASHVQKRQERRNSSLPS